MYKILTKTGEVRCPVYQISYDGTLNGTRTLSVTVESPMPIEWAVDGSDYLVYRNERYAIRYIPKATKQARGGTSSDAFVYDFTLNSHGDELTTCDFLDVVAEDNEIHYTALPTFSFYCDSIEKFAERLQANLDRIYTGADKWTVLCADNVEITPKSLSFSSVKCSGALEQIYTELKVGHIISNRTITLGAVGFTVPYAFRYGQGKGLKSIEQEIDAQQAIVTRARVYGSSKNLPYRYYNKLRFDEYGNIVYIKDGYPEPEEAVISASMYVPHLMLPMFRENGKDAYIDNEEAIAKYGIREGTVFFDGSAENEEVYPTIEGLTVQDLTDAGIDVEVSDTDNGNLDEVVYSNGNVGDGIIPDNGELSSEESYFYLWIKDIGFDLNDYKSTEVMEISLKSGGCAGRSFEIVECIKPESTFGYRLKLKKVIDEDLLMYFPNATYPIDAGNKFVLLNIEMPDVYVKAAEVRLKKKGEEWLLNNCFPSPVITPTLDNIEIFRDGNIAEHLIEGNKIVLEDEDLGISKVFTITNLKIAEGKDLIPQYEVTLSNNETVSFAQRITQSVKDNLLNGSATDAGLALAIGRDIFLQKKRADTALAPITFQRGLRFPNGQIDEHGNLTANTADIKGDSFASGFKTSKDFIAGLLGQAGALYNDDDGFACLDVDKLTVRQVLSVLELVIQKAKVVGGMLVVSAASGKITEVVDDGQGYYSCLITDESDGRFAIDDWVRCSRWDSATNTLHSYWYAIRDISNEDGGYWVTLECTTDVLPQVNDQLVLMGNVSDTTRQGFIVISVEDGHPRIDEYDGVDSASLDGKLQGRFGDLSGITWQGKALSGFGVWTQNLYGRGDLIVGDSETAIADYIAEKIGDLQAGGSNLLIGTNQGASNWIAFYGVDSAYMSFVKEAYEYAGQSGVKFFSNGDYVNDSWLNYRYPVKAERIKMLRQYAVSADVFCPVLSETTRLRCVIRNESLGALTPIVFAELSQGWNHVTFVLAATAESEETGYNVVFETVDDSNGFLLVDGIVFVNLMLVEGNVPSAWSSAPEDTDNKITNLKTVVNSQFEVVDGQMTSLQERVTTTESQIMNHDGDVERLDMLIEANTSRIEQNADAIEAEVVARTTKTDELGTRITDNTSLINATATQIRSEVSEQIEDVNGNITSMYSQIKQEADSIALVIRSDNTMGLQLNAQNLLLGTANGDTSMWKCTDSVNSLALRNYVADDGTIGMEIYRSSIISLPSYEYFGYYFRGDKITLGKQYAISFDITLTLDSTASAAYPRVCLRGINTGSLSAFYRDSSLQLVSGVKTRVIIQVTATADPIDDAVYVVGIDFVNSSNSSTGVWGQWTSAKVENIMLQEIGDDATIYDYTLAPEDFPNALEETGIFLNKRKIQLKSDTVEVVNNNGETTLLLDSEGLLNTNLINARSISAGNSAGQMVMSLNANDDKAYKLYHENGNPMLVIGQHTTEDAAGNMILWMISCYDEAGLFLWGIPYGDSGSFYKPELPYTWADVVFISPSLYDLNDTAPSALAKSIIGNTVTYFRFNSDSAQYADYNGIVCSSKNVDALADDIIPDGIYWNAMFASFGNLVDGNVISYTHTRLGIRYKDGRPVTGESYKVTWTTYVNDDYIEL